MQFLSCPDSASLWVSEAEPGSRHDLTCARIHALSVLYPAATQGLRTLVDVGYLGAGIGVHTPICPHLDILSPLTSDNRAHSLLLRSTRALGERAAVGLKQRWQALNTAR